MSILGTIATNAASTAIGSGFGMLTGAVDYNNDKKLMGLQAEYNEKAAQANQERNKELWDYTNYENQRKHMENAGLNPALMYGMSGGGGSSASGAQAQGVSGQSSKQGQQGLQGAMMGLQLAQAESQVELNKANAEKAKAEAAESGSKKENIEATTENIIQLTTNEKAKEELIYAQKRFTEAQASLTEAKEGAVFWEVQQLIKSTEKMNKEIQGTELDNELKSKTMETNIKQAEEQVRNTMADTFAKSSHGKVNVEQAKAIVNEIQQKWQEVKIKGAMKEQGWRGLELEAERIYNDMNLREKGLEIENERLTKDWIIGMGSMVINAIK